MIYDRSLSDASLLAREKVVKELRPHIYNLILVGREKRNVNLHGGSWSGMTFKHILLPVWIGTYKFQGEEYHLLVNGQTGKVGGHKPRDTVKVVMFMLIFLIILAFMIIGGLWLWTQYGGSP